MQIREIAFHYTGQPASAFPAWLRFTNYARAADGSLLLIHRLDDVLRVAPGDTLYRRTDGELRVGEADPPKIKHISFCIQRTPDPGIAELLRDQRLMRGA